MSERTGEQIVLVADDDPGKLESLFEVFDDEGVKVLIALNGESALEQALAMRPNLILLDIDMPGMDGFETCHRLKEDERTRDMPVLFMTAYGAPGDKLKGFSLGAVDYITKPLQHDEVLARVRTHLTLASLEQSLREKNAVLEHELVQRQKAEERRRRIESRIS